MRAIMPETIRTYKDTAHLVVFSTFQWMKYLNSIHEHTAKVTHIVFSGAH